MDYYQSEFNTLEMYQRLIQYWSKTFDPLKDRGILDSMNFSRSVFPQIFEPSDVELLHPIEPGYTSPDGYVELNRFIRDLEVARLSKTIDMQAAQNIMNACGLGCGNGCTNVMNAVINSIIRLRKDKYKYDPRTAEVILALPNYTVYSAQLSNIREKVTPVYVFGKRAQNFLPSYDDICAVITDATICIVLTYPNNPAQSTYSGEGQSNLKKIVELCQERGIFLIVDNIYQDLIFDRSALFTEVMSLTDHPKYIIKVYGSSKDTPFFAGFRTGYWVGDPRITDYYRYFISATENSLNTTSNVMFGLNLFCKRKKLLQEPIVREDMEAFSYGFFGWGQKAEKQRIFDNFQKTQLLEKYCSRIDQSNKIQGKALETVKSFVESSKVFIDYVNEDVGNVFFIRIDERAFPGNDHQFFNYLFDNLNIAVLPGNVFGMDLYPSQIWFRITLIHQPIAETIRLLQTIETELLKGCFQQFG